ncbi:MAG: hypothetical protein IKU71_03425 [Kiritimatiellae bacterium]|nr:hypothetical protein [Kiritimatiellia bacterium]
MKITFKAIALLVGTFAGVFASRALAGTGWTQTTWADKINNAHDFFDTANWDDGDINGVFGTGLGSAKVTQYIKLGQDWSSAFSFQHSNEANLTFVGDGSRNATWFVPGNMAFAPSATKGVICFGNESAGRKFLLDLGAAKRKFTLSGTAGYVFANSITNGDLEISSTAPVVSLRYSDATIDGNLDFYGTKLQFDSSKNDTIMGLGAVRAKNVVFSGQELEVKGGPTVASADSIDGLLIVDGSRGALKLVSIVAGTAGSSFTADGLSVTNDALLGFRGAGLGGTPGAGVANVFFVHKPETVGGTGGTECPVLPNVIASPTYGNTSILGYAYDTSLATYDTTTGVRPLDFSTEYVTSIADVTSGRENLLVAHGASVEVSGDVTVNSVVLQGGAGSTPSTLSGGEGAVLRVTSGQVLVGYHRNANPVVSVSVPIDFGTRRGCISYANGKSTAWSSPISGSRGVALTWFSLATTQNAGITMSADCSYTGDTYVNGTVFIGMKCKVLPCAERTGDVYVRGVLGFNGSSKGADIVHPVINGLYGDGTIKRVSYNIDLDVGDNNADGDFDGVMQDFNYVYKIGSGSQRFGGTISVNNAFNINAGTVILDGAVMQGAVNVAAGAALGGSGGITNTVTFADGAKLAVTVVDGVASCLTVAGTVGGGPVTVDAKIKSGKWKTAQCILTSGTSMGEMTFVKGAGVGSLELRNNGTELWATSKTSGFCVVIR